jgi:hypothetical protein
MNRLHRILHVALPLVALTACGDPEAEDCEDRTWTCSELQAVFADGAGNYSVSCNDSADTFTLTSTGVPDYTSNQSTPNSIGTQNWTVVFPKSLSCASSAEDVTGSRGEVGFTVNGLPFYGPEDALGRDAIVYEGPTMDDCEGHADQSCTYHHHSEPVCVFGTSTQVMDLADSDDHPPVVALSGDGYPVYGVDPAGPSLDDCNGHNHDDYGYHYHMTDDYPYTIGCYAGEDRMSATRSGGC